MRPRPRLLETALAGSPLDYGYPVTTWTVADLTDLLAQRGLGRQPGDRLPHACSAWAIATVARATT